MFTKAFLAVNLIAGLLSAAVPHRSLNPAIASLTSLNRSHGDGTKNSFGHLDLQFEPNQKQAGSRYDFVSHGPGYDLLLAAGTAVFVPRKEVRPANYLDQRECVRPAQSLIMRLVGANADSQASGETKLPGFVNYLLGNDPRKHHVGIPTYRQVRYTSVYPGIDMLYYGKQGQLEYDLIVQPGGKVEDVGFQFEGVDEMKIDSRGDVVLSAGADLIRLNKPIVYQEAGGYRAEIGAQYQIKDRYVLNIQIGNYDHNRPLVIDPVLGFSSYLGGSGSEQGDNIKTDAAGNVFVTGFTTSAAFPHSDNSVPKGGFDVFITKLSPSGQMIFSTFFGGSGFDTGLSVAVDGTGIYVAGVTDSKDYPTTKGAFQETTNANQSAFVTKLNLTGTGLLYSTYFGGGGLNNGAHIILDPAGDIYLGGTTASLTLPTTSGAFQSTRNGLGDAYVAKIHPAGSGASDLIYSSYLGGKDQEDGSIYLALDSAGFVYLAGTTTSTDFPITNDALLKTIGGGADGYLIKMNLRASGSASLVYSTYLGGSGDERVMGIASDGSNNIYLTGVTGSPNFPVTATALQVKLAGATDAFVMKLNPARSGLTAIVYSTYLGGTDAENSFGGSLAVDGVGNVYLTGDTKSIKLPVTVGAFQPSIGGISDAFSAPGGDAFVAKLNAAGTALVYFTYLGGRGGDGADAIAIDSQGNAYVTGYTFSDNFPLSPGALQSTLGGSFDAFVSRINNPTSFNQPAAASRAERTQPFQPDSLANPIDDPQKFVRQQYLDFLGREPDSDGLNFWTNEITSCGSDSACIEVKRINVSAAFFLSIEFQQTGYLVDRLYLITFARTPRLREFWPDSRQISTGLVVNSPGWQQLLENNTQSFMLAFVQRAEFQTAYPASLSASQFVDQLDANAGGVLTSSQKAQLTAVLDPAPNDAVKRAAVVRSIAENSTLQQREFNKAFVLMQYLGYLQRNPDEPPDTDLSGYNFWLSKLNQFNGNFIDAEMVRAFIDSGEYRTRFGQN